MRVLVFSHPVNNSVARLRTNRAGNWSVVFDAVHTKAASWPFSGGRVGNGFMALYGNLEELRVARFSSTGLQLSNERLHTGETHGARMTMGGGDAHFLAYTAQESAGYTLYLRRYDGEALTLATSLPQFQQSVFPNALWPTTDGGLALITSHGEPPYYRYHRLNANLDVLDSGALPWRQGFQGIAPTTGSERYIMLDSTAIDTCVLREHDGNTLATVAEVPFACPGAMIYYGFLGKTAGNYRVAALSGGQLRLLQIGANGAIQSNTLLGEVPFAGNARVRVSPEAHGTWVWVQNSLQQSGGLLFGLNAEQQVVSEPLESRDCIDVATDASGGVRLLCFVAGYDLELRSYAATGALIGTEWLGYSYNNGFTEMHATNDSSVFVQYQRVDVQVNSLSGYSFRDAQVYGDGFEDTGR